jgi:nucleotide-binding universal stress UspA family protein
MFGRILIAVDPDHTGMPAIDVGVRLAETLGARIGLLHIVDTDLAYPAEGGAPPEHLLAEERLTGREALQSLLARLPRPDAEILVREGKPADGIVAAAREWGADLIVLGTEGRKGLSRLLMGSVAEHVLRDAPCPTLVVRDDR